MNLTAKNLAEEVPESIARGAKLNEIMDQLFDVFAAGEEKNTELLNRFLKHSLFTGGESFIDKCAEIQPNIDFSYIEDEGVSLTLLVIGNKLRDFQACLNKVKNGNIEQAFKQEVFERIKSRIGGDELYSDFSTECIPYCNTSEEDVENEKMAYETLTVYLNKIIVYLQRKENEPAGKKTEEILRGLIITNEDLNRRLPEGEKIPSGVPLSTIPKNTKKDFDTLLSFEIGQVADCAFNIANNANEGIKSLFSNSCPTINTIVGENDKLKYDESKLLETYDDYKSKLDTYYGTIERIRLDKNIKEDEKERQINEIENKINKLRWEYYLKYLKTGNNKIGNLLQQLYDNDFDYSELDPSDLQEYLNEVSKIRVNILVDSGIKEAIKANFGIDEEFEGFLDFYKDLVNLSKDKIEFVAGTGMELPVKKEIIKGKNPWLKKIDRFGKMGNPWDTSPISYKIKKSDINSLPLSDDEKREFESFLTRGKDNGTNNEETGKLEGGDTYIIEGGDIWTLLYLFFAINRRTLKTETSSENEENVEKLVENVSDDNNTNGVVENNEGEENFTPEKFKEEIEKLGPGKFENGSEIWVPHGPSELPGGGYQWMKIKISNVNMGKGTFTGTIFGGELEFKKLERQSIKFNMNKGTLDSLKRAANEASMALGSEDQDKVYLLPNPEKSDFNPFKDELNNRLSENNLSFPISGVTRNGCKFMRKLPDENGELKDVEVKYFGTSGDDKATYKIDYNPIRRSFTVYSVYNGEELGKDGKLEKKRFSYKRDMDWNNFLIFFTQKGLKPQTEEESKRIIQNQNQKYKIANGGHWKLYWFSLNNLKNGFKDIIGSLKKGIEQYDKDRTKDFKEIVEGPMLRALSKVPLPPSLKYAVGERQQEIYNERYNGAWPEIEKYLKALQGDGQFADTFTEVPDHVQSIYGRSYRQFIIDLFEKKGKPDKTEQRKAAALLLANIQQGSSPYRGLSDYENEGLWVKAILGEDHHKIFMDDRQKCLDEIEKAGRAGEDGYKEQLQATFATCEMDYIINNVCGSDGKLPFFGSHEERDGYKPNPSKIILSEKFAKELRNSSKWFNNGTIEEAHGNAIKANRNFMQAKADFDRFIKSSRHPGAIGNLKMMIDKAKTESQLYQFRKSFLIYTLSGLLDVYGDKDMREEVYIWGRTMPFLPGMLAYNTGHSEQTAALLDAFCEHEGIEKFSKKVNAYFRKDNLLNGGLNIETLMAQINDWWTPDIDKKFDNYSKHIFKYESFPKGSVFAKLQQELDNPRTTQICPPMLKNSLIANSGGLSSNADIAQNRAQIRDGKFVGDDVKEQEEREKFWRAIPTELKGLDTNNPDHLDFVLTQYLKRFELDSNSDKEQIFKRIKTADYRKDKIGKHSKVEDTHGNEIDLGIIGQKEVHSILWYALKGKVLYHYFSSNKLPKELNDALDAFYNFFEAAFQHGTFNQSNIVHKTFNIEDEEQFGELELGSWEVYSDVIDPNTNGLRHDNNQDKNAIGRTFIPSSINYQIASMEKAFRDRRLTNQYLKIREAQQEVSKHKMASL